MQTATHHALPFASWEAITGSENLLILASHPGDESLFCGGLIARSCRRGRPPFVMVLTDGSASHPPSNAYSPDRLAALHERETRAAVKCLGLPANRLLMAGLFDGTIPREGKLFDALVEGVMLVMWARDCNVICAPWQPSPLADHRAAQRVAAEVAARSGVGLLAYEAADAMLAEQAAAGWRLDITPDLPAKRDAVAAHALRHGEATGSLQPHEAFLLPVTARDASGPPQRL
jgi:LmbE family N-acetylglucosaminyl deacetylase